LVIARQLGCELIPRRIIGLWATLCRLARWRCLVASGGNERQPNLCVRFALLTLPLAPASLGSFRDDLTIGARASLRNTRPDQASRILRACRTSSRSLTFKRQMLSTDSTIG
jgi:hypothetical protein